MYLGPSDFPEFQVKSLGIKTQILAGRCLQHTEVVKPERYGSASWSLIELYTSRWETRLKKS